MALATYNPSELVAVIAGVQVQGFADGTVIEIEYNEDTISLKTGVQGDGVRTINQNRSAKIKIMLQHGSISNAQFTALAALDRPRDRRTVSGRGVGTCTITDLNGTLLASCKNIWIVKSAKATFAKESEPREWNFETDDLHMIHGAAVR